MTGVVEMVAAQTTFWGGAYFMVGGAVRFFALTRLRRERPQGGEFRGTVRVGGRLVRYGDRGEGAEKWLTTEAPRLVLRVRLWYLWPLALAKGTNAEVSEIEAEIGAAVLKRMTKERDALEKRIVAEAARQKEMEA